MKTLKYKIEGICPIMVCSPRMANPLDPIKKEKSEYTSKRKKTDEDIKEIARLDWYAAMYYDNDLGPYIPGQNVERMLLDSARINRLGQQIKRGVVVMEDRIQLLYEGPRKLEKMFGNGDTKFVDIRGVVVKGSRVMACRPIFPEWSLEFSVAINEDVINPNEVHSILSNAGLMVGLGTFRPRFGRFKIVSKD
jgi:hypothetical protein